MTQRRDSRNRILSDRPPGRPSLAEYWTTEEGLLQIEEWFGSGLTNKKIAQNIGVSYKTWNEWKTRFPVIGEHLERGRQNSIELVENALFNNATGSVELSESKKVLVPYTEKQRLHLERKALEKAYKENPNLTEDEEFEIVMSIPMGRLVETELKRKENKPDTAAQIFYLKNKASDKWSDKRTVEMDSKVEINPLEGMTTEDIAKIALSNKRDKLPKDYKKK